METVQPRRDFLKLSAAGVAGTLLGSSAHAQSYAQRARPLRVIHMTDHHLMDFLHPRGSRQGIEAAFAHAMSFNPDLILNGGDLLTHAPRRPLDDVLKDGKIIQGLMPKGVRIINAIGNNDIWGWQRQSGAIGNEPLFGKNFFKEYFGEGHLYRSVDLGAWTLLVLDSVRWRADGLQYEGGLDDEQFEWLKGELEDSDKRKPVIVLSHIPILNAGIILQDAVTGPEEVRSRGVTIPVASGHQDLWRVVDLFYRHGNVKIALSGHVHVDEWTDIHGTRRISSGAVCGSWWMPREEYSRRSTAREARENTGIIRPPRADPGFEIFHLYPDGSFEHRYELVPWEFF